MNRSAGILLPIFSLPGEYGIGGLGREARAFVDFLAASGQHWWQILPVGPTGGGNSPYTSLSTFAGNPLFIDPEQLAADGLLTAGELKAARLPEKAKIDYETVNEVHEAFLRKAFSRLSGDAAQAVRDFSAGHPWLKEYALYRALKAKFDDKCWLDWPDQALRRHDPDAVERQRVELAEEIAYHSTLQYWFVRQWGELKQYANDHGVGLIGDLPIYVSLDSADVWSERSEFQLDPQGHPTQVAGVPPDYFSADGQLWGNPLYDWDAQRANGFGWWIRRVEGASALCDAIRIDHFRGLESYWAVPADAETARAGHWEKGPGMDLLGVLTGWFPQLTYIAEDLGIITDEVHRLRETAGLPGMKVLEFAFSDPSNAYLPQHYNRHCICYTGTHDNNTAVGWYRNARPEEKAFAETYLGTPGPRNIARALIRAGQTSVAELFIAQLQDYLGLGQEARINVPGVAEGNWAWRLTGHPLTPELAEEIHGITAASSRC